MKHLRLTDDVAHALLRAVSRLVSTLVAEREHFVEVERRHERRRGTQECVRHIHARRFVT